MSNIITQTGQAVIAAALANGTTIDITHIALGSSARFPTGGETSLETEVYRDLVSESGLVAGSPNEAYFKFTVPEDGVAPGFDYGPWTAQEVGLFDVNGDLIVIGRFPEPLPKYDPASGSPNAINITIRVIFANIEAININYVPNFNLPWASDADAIDENLELRIIDPKRLWLAINTGQDPHLAQLDAPVYPHVLASDLLINATDNLDGTVTIDAGQSWLHRGIFKFSTDDIAVGARTLAHVASKTHHLRWHAPGTGTATPEVTYPNGRFVLNDLADVGYNPSVLTERSATFDTTYDDMLVARVVTDGANVPTITTLANSVMLGANIEWVVATVTSAEHDTLWGVGGYTLMPWRFTGPSGSLLVLPPSSLVLNWARTPVGAWQINHRVNGTWPFEPPNILIQDGLTYFDNTGPATVVADRYQQYPVGWIPTNDVPNGSYITSYEIQGVFHV